MMIFFDSARVCMNEKNVFGENGFIHQFPEIRDKLIFLFDDGWDVPYGLANNNNGDFGSLIVNEERFPFCTGEPKEKMKKLADKVRSYGWKGVGLWICASAKGEVNEVNIEFDKSVEDKKIFAQDLASEEAIDITNDCIVNENIVKISGDLIDKIGKSKNCFGDKSKPGLVIKLI